MIVHQRTTWRQFWKACRAGEVPTWRQISRYIGGRSRDGEELAFATGCVRAVLDRPTQIAAGETLADDLLDLVAYAVELRNARSRAVHPSARAALARVALADPVTNPGMCRDLAQCAQTCHRLEQAEAALADRSAS